MKKSPGKKIFRKKTFRKRNPKKYFKKRSSMIPTAPSTHTVVKLRYTEEILLSTTALFPNAAYIF